MRSIFSPLIDALLSPIVRAKMRAPIKTVAGRLSQDEVDAIVNECGGPSGMVMLSEGNLIIMPTEDVLLTGRVLRALQATGETTLSKVGNARHDSSTGG